MGKREQQSLDEAARDLPLITLIEEVRRRAEEVKPLLDQPKPNPGQGTLDCRIAVSSLVAQGLDAAAREDKDRHLVAADMGRFMGTGSISKARLDKLAAPSQEGYDIRAHEIPAFCLATGDLTLITYLAERAGLRVVLPEDLALVELGRLVQADSEVSRAKASLLESISNAGGRQCRAS